MGQMAQKISKVDHDELLKALNEALSEEWLAYYQYWVGALVAKGPMRTSIVAEFMEHANEEYDHANKLGKRIRTGRHAGSRSQTMGKPCPLQI